MKCYVAIFLVFSALLISGCTSVDDKKGSTYLEYVPDENNSIVDDLQSPMKKIYNVVKKDGFYDGKYINVSWRLEDDREGFTPSSGKILLIDLVEHPYGDDYIFPYGVAFATFNEGGFGEYSLYTSIPGKYVFRISGLGHLNDGVLVDEGTYSGDGDEIVVIVPEKPEIFIGESSFEIVGYTPDGRYYDAEFRWDLEFFNKSTEGICALVGHNLVTTKFWYSDMPDHEGYSNTWKCQGNTLIAKAGSVEASFDGPITVKVSLWEFPDNVIYKGGSHEIVGIIPKRERI